jgi:hypothetical protein
VEQNDARDLCLLLNYMTWLPRLEFDSNNYSYLFGSGIFTNYIRT